MATQKLDNGLLGSYPVEVEQQGDGSLRQVVKVASLVASGSLGANSAVTSVAGSASSVTLKAANTSRIELIIVNDSTAVLFVLLGSGTASNSNYTYRLAQYDTVIVDTYNGIVKGIWEAATGAARVTEITA